MNSLCKDERLVNEILFEELLRSDYSFVSYPFRIVAKRSSLSGKFPARIAISVSKKKFKHAVLRNRMKRLTRECFRCNKELLYQSVSPEITIDILFIYLDQQLMTFSKIEKTMQAALVKIAQHFNHPSHYETDAN
ncbi:ribonuclease P protein component [Odoribacter lunatus]|uniref:ribonuclease P protein component n=1 Tax=Odoribacter lunatus TaxID=2941335 RepID=UPI00203F356A|nr:ribonuclease P protein component [Odoribacter lunatus]